VKKCKSLYLLLENKKSDAEKGINTVVTVNTLKALEMEKSYAEHFADHGRKKGVYITARVHPGESNSSFIMQGILDYLLADNKEAKALR
jgi:hypothetical protein